MRSLLSVCMMAAVLASTASAAVLLTDGFGYADQAAMNAAWNGNGNNTVYMVDPAFGNPAGSYKMPSPATSFSSGRLAKNLGGDFNGTDAQPLVFSFDLYLDPAGTSLLWNGARHFVELRGYSGDAYVSGSLQNIVALGLFNSTAQAGDGTFSNKWYNARLYGATDGDWAMLNQQAGAPQRAGGWHNLKAIIKSTQIEFYIDNTLAETRNRPNNYGFDCVVLGSGNTANGVTVWVDNAMVQTTPEPATITLLALAGLSMLRRRR